MQQSEIIHHKSGGTTFSGPDAVNLVRAVYLRSHLRLYAKTGITPTRTVTGPGMLKIATEYTGKTYKRGQYIMAAEDLDVWISTMQAALPVSQL